ncbi:MAG: hypothetical protein J6V25_09480 [Oscillospiraceae bacterium]|nr:hypothetical protein [Oscillospiraceae bacterium]
MNKDILRVILGLVIALLLYLLVAFAIPFVHTSIFWLSLVFTLLAFVVAGTGLYVAFWKYPDAKSHFYGFPIAKLSVLYGAGQMVVSLVFMALGMYIPFWIAILVYAMGIGLALIGLLTVDGAVDEIRVQDQELKKNVYTMRSLQSRVQQLMTCCQTPEAVNAVGKLAEELRYSDPVSSPALEAIEGELVSLVDNLQFAAVNGNQGVIPNICQKCTVILAERNRMCKLNKH